MDTIGFLLGILGMVFFGLFMATCIALVLATAGWLQQGLKEMRRKLIGSEKRNFESFPLPKWYLWLVACVLSLFACYVIMQWTKEVDNEIQRRESMRTVRELKNQVQAEAGGEMQSLSPACLTFWSKLNQLGFERRTREPEHCADIDATAPVSDAEYELLLTEFRDLPKTWFN